MQIAGEPKRVKLKVDLTKYDNKCKICHNKASSHESEKTINERKIGRKICRINGKVVCLFM